jgi:dTDP-4-dehydrorhamnose reductase
MRAKKHKKLVVVGAGGRLGMAVVEHFSKQFKVIGIDHKRMDLCCPVSIEETLVPMAFDQVIITGALTAVDYCETHSAEAFLVNSEGPARIAEIAAAKKAHVTFISSDMVFDGNKSGLYQETDSADPISVYGASKLAGEAGVLAASAANLVLRVSWVYGPGRVAFPEWIVGKACAEERISLPSDKISCPTYTCDLAKWMNLLVSPEEGGAASGIYHLCNNGPCTWQEWGQVCIDAAREAGFPILADEITGIPVDSVEAFAAKRPVNSAMSTEKFTSCTGVVPQDWSVPLRNFVIQNGSFMKYKPASLAR